MPQRTESELLTARLRLRMPRPPHLLNLFYRFDPAAWGRGVATEAVTAVVEWVHRVRPDQQLVARIRPRNSASARVAAKAGLVRAAELDTDGEDGPDHIWLLPPRQRQ